MIGFRVGANPIILPDLLLILLRGLSCFFQQAPDFKGRHAGSVQHVKEVGEVAATFVQKTGQVRLALYIRRAARLDGR